MATLRTFDVSVDPTLDPLARYGACKAMGRGYAESKKTDKSRLAHARAYCAAVINSYWFEVAKRNGTSMKVKPVPVALPQLPIDVQKVAGETGRLIADFPLEDAGYLIGSIYTVMLPVSLRSEMGAYYTPPPLVSRLLDLAEEAGFDFAYGSAIDPACGGGAFLAPVAIRMIARSNGASPDWTIRRLGKRLKGIELDPFAAWMTRVILDAAVMPLAIKAQRRLADVVTVGDALEPRELGGFDLVIGNPPYGRVSLKPSMREHYARSLYGHANLYGLFTDLALRLAKPTGVVAYLTPTSFLGGQYFKALRELLTKEACPAAFDFVSDRNGVFDDVLQETMLTTYKRGSHVGLATVSVLEPKGLNAARVDRIGEVGVARDGAPWLLPRRPSDSSFLQSMTKMTTRLIDLGYTVSTGPLVWNRHRAQLRSTWEEGALPLVWAESVIPEGFFFSSERRNHVPFIQVQQDQPHLVVRESCVLVQRTTSKEQNRRLLSAVLPQEFLDSKGGAVIENHLNMIQPAGKLLTVVSPKTISVLINSQAVDRAFRCISGSVAVSAYELNALPLPTLRQVQELGKLVMSNSPASEIERTISSYYGIDS